jgi:hypothetical protein
MNIVQDVHLELELTTPDFFGIPLKKLRLEDKPFIGRVYFLKGDVIVAVARKPKEHGDDPR